MEHYVKEECEGDKNKFPQTNKNWMKNSNMFKVENSGKYGILPLAPLFSMSPPCSATFMPSKTIQIF